MGLRYCLSLFIDIQIKLIVKFFIYVYKKRFKFCDDGVIFNPINSNFSYKNISVGKKTFIGGKAWFSADRSKILIGSYVMFGPNVTLLGGDHEFLDTSMPMILVKKNRESLDMDIIIGNDVWIGANATILKGVKVGDGAIVAAGSVVTREVEPYCIYGGVPAKKIADRFSGENLDKYKFNMRSYFN